MAETLKTLHQDFTASNCQVEAILTWCKLLSSSHLSPNPTVYCHQIEADILAKRNAASRLRLKTAPSKLTCQNTNCPFHLGY